MDDKILPPAKKKMETAGWRYKFRGNDAWRNHPRAGYGLKLALPGLGWGAALFGVYCVFDFVTSFGGKKDDKHH